MIAEMDKRARDIFQLIVNTYMETGEPVGSRTISRLGINLSPASIRNVMADLEADGLIYAPHTSAGRLPTDIGLRIYVDDLLGESTLSDRDRCAIEAECRASGQSMQGVMEKMSRTLSDLSAGIGMVASPKTEKPVEHIEFMYLERGKALAILMLEDGVVENRIMEIDPSMTRDILNKASRFLKERLYGKTIADMKDAILREINARRSELDALTTKMIEEGLALKLSGNSNYLIVQGHSNILNQQALQDINHIQRLFGLLEQQETASRLLDEAAKGNGVQIFIGAENAVFGDTGLSMVVSPYKNAKNRIVGAIGVIGPQRLNYRRVIPLVDYTSQMMAQMIGSFTPK